jgi:hypothetical protein
LESDLAFKGEPAVGGGVGLAFIETDSPVPPLCFWRSSEIQRATIYALDPFGAGVKQSVNPPQTKAYRWALGVTLESPSRAGYTVGSEPHLIIPYCFQPLAQRTTSGYGIGFYDGSTTVGIALTNERILNVFKHVIGYSDFVYSGNDLLITPAPVNPGMLPFPTYRDYNPNPPSNVAMEYHAGYWYPSKYQGYIRAEHNKYQTKKGYPTTKEPPDKDASWLRNKIVSSGAATHVVDLNTYQ